MSCPPRDPGENEDLVLTPGGPRPKDNVHLVKPDEAVRRNEEGVYAVVPKEQPVSGNRRKGEDDD